MLIIISRGFSGLLTDSPCSVWGCGWTTCLQGLNDNWCVRLTYRRGIILCYLAFMFVFIHYTSFTWYIPQKGPWHGAFMISVICARTNGCTNDWNVIDLRRHCAHYDVTVMFEKSGLGKTYKRPSFPITIFDLYCIPLVRLVLRFYGRVCSSTLLFLLLLLLLLFLFLLLLLLLNSLRV